MPPKRSKGKDPLYKAPVSKKQKQGPAPQGSVEGSSSSTPTESDSNQPLVLETDLSSQAIITKIQTVLNTTTEDKTDEPAQSPSELKEFQTSLESLSEVTLSEEDLLAQLKSFKAKEINEENFDEGLKIAKMALARFSLAISDILRELLAKSSSCRYIELQLLFNYLTNNWNDKETLIKILATKVVTTEVSPQVSSSKTADDFDFDSHFVNAPNLQPQVSKFLREQIDTLRMEYKTGNYRFPYAPLIQASGVGKSYQTCQMRYHGAWIFYMCFRVPFWKGHPARSSVADFYTDPINSMRLREDALGNQDWSKVAYRCFYAACLIQMKNWILRRLEEHLRTPSDNVLESLQVEWGSLQLSEKSEAMFWDPIVKRTKFLFSSFFVSFQKQDKGQKANGNFFYCKKGHPGIIIQMKF